MNHLGQVDRNASPTRWHSIFAILSLDCLVPHWERMGLIVRPERKQFIKLASREGYLVFHRTQENYFDADFSKVDEAINYFTENARAYAVENEAINSVINWGSCIYLEQSQGAVEHQWQSVLIQMKREFPHLRCPLLLSPDKASWLIEKIETGLVERLNEIHQLLDHIDESLISEWDRRMRLNASLPDLEDEPNLQQGFWYPLLSSGEMLKFVNFHHFWAEVVSTFTNEDLNNLLVWYTCQAAAQVERFPHLRQKPELWRCVGNPPTN